MLYRAALDAIIQHNYAQSRLTVAKLQRDSDQIKVGEPAVERLLQARRAAVRTYQEHVDTHTTKSSPKRSLGVARMDLEQILNFLRAEKEKLDRVIASLEELQAIHSDSATQQRRGRKSMSEEERRQVSARMKRFWTERRKRHPPSQ